MTIERARVGTIELAYERLGDPSAPPVLLIMGLGAQLIGWPDGFCDALVQQRLHVIRFDNRDAGESTHFTATPDFAAATRGDSSTAPYTLSDMANDAVGLLDHLHIEKAHVVGMSMGGFIAQTIAIEHPTRILTLTSISSSTGDPAVGRPHADAMALFAGPPPITREQVVARALAMSKVICSPGFARDETVIAERAGRAFDRGFDLGAYPRQGAAVLASGDRTARLRAVQVPTLVIHGDADVLVDVSGGRATAAAIPGSELLIIPGMGHDLPRDVWPRIAGAIAALRARSDRDGRAG